MVKLVKTYYNSSDPFIGIRQDYKTVRLGNRHPDPGRYNCTESVPPNNNPIHIYLYYYIRFRLPTFPSTSNRPTRTSRLKTRHRFPRIRTRVGLTRFYPCQTRHLLLPFLLALKLSPRLPAWGMHDRVSTTRRLWIRLVVPTQSSFRSN